jgi:integrase/recombinase XerD
MNDSPEKISPLRRRMIEDMRMRKLSTKTQDTYIRAVRHFAGYLDGRSARADPKPRIPAT